jgi:hypothetical protein
MQLTQLVYVSSYMDESGLELPEFIGISDLANHQLGVRGMTLFSNGSIIQMLEGQRTAVNEVFRRLPAQTRQFQVIEMLQEPINAPCLEETSIGLSLGSLRLVKVAPPHISLFKLDLQEVDSRVGNSPGKVLMQQFAADHLSLPIRS